MNVSGGDNYSATALLFILQKHEGHREDGAEGLQEWRPGQGYRYGVRGKCIKYGTAICLQARRRADLRKLMLAI